MCSFNHVAIGTLLAGALLGIGCGSNNNNNFVLPPLVLVAPVAVNDNYAVLGNSQLQVPAATGVLVNDTPNSATIINVQTATTRGGAVAVNADGSFTYTPPLNQGNVSDTFTYTLSNSGGTSTATVTVAIGARAFFVRNDAAAGGNGSQQAPFNNLATAVAQANGVAGAEIVVFQGNGTSAGQNTAIVLGANQVLRAFDANAPLLTGPVTLANNTTLTGLRINGGGGVVVNGAQGFSVQNCTVSNTTADGLAMTNPTGNGTLLGNNFLQNGARGVTLTTNAGVLNLTLTNNTISNSTTDGVLANVTNTANVTWTESGSRINNAGQNPFGNSWNLFTRDTADLNGTFTGCLSEGATRFGFEAQSFNASNCTLVFDQSVVRNGASRGIVFDALGSSTLKARVSATQTNQNNPGFGFEASSNSLATLCLRLVGVTSDVYRLGQNNPAAPFHIENFANFNTENTGNINILVGTITSVPVGSCGIP